MKRGKRDFKLSNRWLYTFIILGIFAVVGVGVYAAQQASAGGTHNYAEVGIPSCSDGQVLKWSGSAWVCGTDNSGSSLPIRAYSNGAVEIGSGTVASGNYALATGYNTQAVGAHSTTMGFETTATDNYATAMGYKTVASGFRSTAMGYKTVASGRYSTAMGYETTAEGIYSVAMGNAIKVTGAGSVGMGLRTNFFWADPWVVTRDNTLAIDGDIYYRGIASDISDIRLKENIIPLDGSLNKILNLSAFSYNLIDNPDSKREYGLSAQEVQKVFPEVVSIYDEENGYLGISYPLLIPVLIQSIKEQQEIINSQQEKLDKICSKLPSLCE